MTLPFPPFTLPSPLPPQSLSAKLNFLKKEKKIPPPPTLWLIIAANIFFIQIMYQLVTKFFDPFHWILIWWAVLTYSSKSKDSGSWDIHDNYVVSIAVWQTIIVHNYVYS